MHPDSRTYVKLLIVRLLCKLKLAQKSPEWNNYILERKLVRIHSSLGHSPEIPMMIMNCTIGALLAKFIHV